MTYRYLKDHQGRQHDTEDTESKTRTHVVERKEENLDESNDAATEEIVQPVKYTKNKRSEHNDTQACNEHSPVTEATERPIYPRQQAEARWVRAGRTRRRSASDRRSRLNRRTCVSTHAFHQTFYRQAQEEWTNLNEKERRTQGSTQATTGNRTKLRMNETKENIRN